MLKRVWYFLICTLVTNQGWAASAEASQEVLRKSKPALYRLYTEYSVYSTELSKYASQQGFRAEFENLATVVHELVHIASAAHDGYFIDGVYYEPYAKAEHWPTLRNKDIQGWLQPADLSVISQVYLPSTPMNGMGNILDEINAYTHVIEFVCANEPASAGKQITNLSGFLRILEVYFRVLEATPVELQKLHNNRLSSGAVETLAQRAHESLMRCGVPSLRHQFSHTDRFLRTHRQRWQDKPAK